MKTNFTAALLLPLLLATTIYGQTTYRAWDMPTVSVGNQETKDRGICNDFQVLQPITIYSLGAFDSGGDGIQGSATPTIQLFQFGEKKTSLLLETLTFDNANPGELIGGYRYKPLARPVTLLPGRYTVAADGFDQQNPEYNNTKTSDNQTLPQITLNTGGGLIRFLGCNRYHRGDIISRSKQAKEIGAADRYAAGTFTFSAATLPEVSYAADYAALTAGVTSFGVNTSRSNNYGKIVIFNHFGSLAVVDYNAFPVLVEPSGSRLILEAAGVYNGDQNGARCVAFAHQQWGHIVNDERGIQFENAIKWASRKTNPADITIGLTTNIDAAFYLSHGYQVRTVARNVQEGDPNPLPGCDVLVVDFHDGYNDQFFARVAEFTASGGNLVATFLPWSFVHGNIRPLFYKVNAVLQPFGLTYRSSLTQPGDYGFTNIQSVPYPTYFSGFPAADLLRQDRQGQIQLDSLKKAIAMHTITYVADGRPDLLAALTAAYSGNTNGGTLPAGIVNTFVDVATLTGAQTTSLTADTTNSPARWNVDGNDLVAKGRRGSAEFTFSLPIADVYKLQIFGTQNLPKSSAANFDLVLSVDGINLGRFNLQATYGVNGMVECLTPYLTPGTHTLKILWDNAKSRTQFRLQGVRVQTGLGADSDANDIKDWVENLVVSQSGMDLTNDTMTSYVSPVCIEGRDPYPSLMSLYVDGADANTPALNSKSAPNNRWYANVPLANAGETVLHASYQNGAKSEVKHLQWLPVNVLSNASYTIRKGDSLVLIARPADWTSGGNMQFTVGTNETPSRAASQQMPYKFRDAGVFTVTGTYTKQGVTQNGSITVKVVDYSFTNRPACRVGQERYLDLVNVPPELTLQADSRLFTEYLTALPNHGQRYGLLIDQNEPRQLLARLGNGGPVLDSTAVKGFTFASGNDTYAKVIQTYPDQSQLVEMLLLMSPVLPDVTVKLEVVVGGVTFVDGTTSKTLTPADFDNRGQCPVQFIRPAAARTSVCHSIRVYQGNDLVGEIR